MLYISSVLLVSFINQNKDKFILEVADLVQALMLCTTKATAFKPFKFKPFTLQSM